ncbi:S26 family signal peptidase [Heyndrickxia sp. NPDC080065]|uniref:S26 family signal peptidase n=1 Tax=Heyndrickxia sp. NPDC080065 TaxID=3390568 RepID=UPI003D03D313
MKKIIILGVIISIISGCSLNSSTEGIKDEKTKPEMITIDKISNKMITFHSMSDSMDRGNHEYSDKVFAIDPTIDKKGISRGNIVLFKDKDGEKRITRIVALPTETIHIQKGQIFVNDKKLDTFYGSMHRLGSTKEEYFKAMEKNNINHDKKGMIEFFDQDKKSTKLQETEFFTTGDDWLRSDQKIINENDIIGLVLGYKN